MFVIPKTIQCPKCGEEIQPGLMNITHHWTACRKNNKLVKILNQKTPLIDEIKRTQKIK
jgi:hypothetical protein